MSAEFYTQSSLGFHKSNLSESGNNEHKKNKSGHLFSAYECCRYWVIHSVFNPRNRPTVEISLFPFYRWVNRDSRSKRQRQWWDTDLTHCAEQPPMKNINKSFPLLAYEWLVKGIWGKLNTRFWFQAKTLSCILYSTRELWCKLTRSRWYIQTWEIHINLDLLSEIHRETLNTQGRMRHFGCVLVKTALSGSAISETGLNYTVHVYAGMEWCHLADGWQLSVQSRGLGPAQGFSNAGTRFSLIEELMGHPSPFRSFPSMKKTQQSTTPYNSFMTPPPRRFIYSFLFLKQLISCWLNQYPILFYCWFGVHIFLRQAWSSWG